MRTILGAAAVTALAAALISGADQTPPTGPRYTPDGELLKPQDYREWVFLSSGVGMTYGPLATEDRRENPFFDNVFVPLSAYKSFLAKGTWPDKTMLVLEIRTSQSKVSINKAGHVQDEVRAVEVEVKDESRFPGKWAFFAFPNGSTAGKQIPANASCYTCHAANGAVDNTFVQFYPTLYPVAKAKGTVKASGTALE